MPLPLGHSLAELREDFARWCIPTWFTSCGAEPKSRSQTRVCTLFTLQCARAFRCKCWQCLLPPMSSLSSRDTLFRFCKSLCKRLLLLRGRLRFSWCSDCSECVHAAKRPAQGGQDCLGDSVDDAPIFLRAQAGWKDSSASNLAAQNIVPGQMRVFGCIKAEDTEIPDTWEELQLHPPRDLGFTPAIPHATYAT